jgi:hypothetical protein
LYCLFLAAGIKYIWSVLLQELPRQIQRFIS